MPESQQQKEQRNSIKGLLGVNTYRLLNQHPSVLSGGLLLIEHRSKIGLLHAFFFCLFPPPVPVFQTLHFVIMESSQREQRLFPEVSGWEAKQTLKLNMKNGTQLL